MKIKKVKVRGGGRLFEGGAYLLFWPRGWALIRGRTLIRTWALIRGNAVLDFSSEYQSVGGSSPGRLCVHHVVSLDKKPCSTLPLLTYGEKWVPVGHQVNARKCWGGGANPAIDSGRFMPQKPELGLSP